jgi:hypothetical protein
VLDRIELGDPQKCIFFALVKGSSDEDLFDFLERFRPRDQETAARRRDLQSASAPAVRTRVADT